MFVLLSGSQQLLDVLGDLLGLADDVLRAGECGVRLRLGIVQLWDGAAFPQPTAAPHPASPAQSRGGWQQSEQTSPAIAPKASLGGVLTPSHPLLSH